LLLGERIGVGAWAPGSRPKAACRGAVGRRALAGSAAQAALGKAAGIEIEKGWGGRMTPRE